MSWNPIQPDRPEYTEDNQFLAYATMPKKGMQKKLFLWTYESMLTQYRLYYAARNGLIESGMAISDLHPYLFGDVPTIGKKQMGRIVCAATIYNPRHLKGRTKNNPYPRVMYVWRDMRELSYGLEWMICTWLPRFCKKYGAPDADYHTKEGIANELADLVIPDETSDVEEDIRSLAEEIFPNEPNWSAITEDLTEREIPQVPETEQRGHRGPRPPVIL